MELTSELLAVLLAGTVGGGLAVNLAAYLAKKWWGLDSDGVLHTITLCFAALATVAEYIMVLKAQLPPQVMGVTGGSIYGFSQAVFKYAKIVSKFLTEVQEFNASQAAKAAADADKAVASVVAPASLVAEPATVSQPDF